MAEKAQLQTNTAETTNDLLRDFEVLAREGLAAWNIDTDSELELIKYRENAVYQLRTSAGECFALRVHRAGYHSDAALRSELQWMTALNQAGLRTPQSIATTEGDFFTCVDNIADGLRYQVDLLSWITGKPLGNIESGPEGDTVMLAGNYRKAGAIAAQLHNLSSDWKKPEAFTRHAWDIDGCFSADAQWGRFQDLDALEEGQRQTLFAARDKLIALLQDLGTGPEVYGLIHCDFLPENLLVSGDDIYLIDFDDAGYGWYLFEIATSMFFLLDKPYFDEVLDAFITGYRSERTLSDEHLALLPAFFMLRAMVYLGWAHTRRNTDTAKELTPIVIGAAMNMAEEFLAAD